MATFQLSPGVAVTETDLTNIIPAVATAVGGAVGKFKWGPAFEPTLVSSEAQLVSQFGGPNTSTMPASNNRLDWYGAANFLAYSNTLQLVRVVPDSATSAASEPTGGAFSIVIPAGITGTAGSVTLPLATINGVATTVTFNTPAGGSSTCAAALATAINALPISATNNVILRAALIPTVGSPGVYSTVRVTPSTVTNIGTTIDANDGSSQLFNGFTFNYQQNNIVFGSSAVIYNEGDFITKKAGLSNNGNGTTYARYIGENGNGIGIVFIDASISITDFVGFPLFGYTINAQGQRQGGTTASALFSARPGTSVWAQNAGWLNLRDEVHAVVYTTDTTATGTAGQVLETYSFLSKAKNGLDTAAQSNYYVDVITAQSSWVYTLGEQFASDYIPPNPDSDLGLGATVVNGLHPFVSFVPRDQTVATPRVGIRLYELGGATDGTADAAVSDYTAGWDLLGDAQQVDVNLLIANNPLDSTTGPSTDCVTIQKYVMGVADARKDCVAFISPGYNAAVNTPTAQDIYDYFNDVTTAFNSSSYAFFDSGWKQQYDRYNDEYFWMPLSADMAGLAANTSNVAADWFSPAGYNRGFVKNVVKLSYNPNMTDRDLLYPGRINPVITERGQGTLLLGDRTALTRPSAFDRLNVRRLFIVLEKAIATAAKYQLFEFNDEFTRANFVSQVEPFLQDIQSRRGLTQFLVVADTSNNTPQVISSNRFVADIYIRPNYSINFITLNFVAVGPNVNFAEITGQ